MHCNSALSPSARWGVPAMLLWTLCTATPVIAATLTVCPTGCDTNSIQAAINAAAPRDEVFLATTQPHTENDIVVFTSVTLRGIPGQSSTLQAAPTGGVTTPRLLTVVAGVEVQIEDLVLRHARTSEDGGLIFNQGTLRLADTSLLISEAARGGAVFNAGLLECNDSDIRWNRARSGGGVFNDTGATLQAEGCQISSNEISALASRATGGNLHNEGSAVLHDSELSFGTSEIAFQMEEAFGGSIYSTGVLELTDVSVSHNTLADSSNSDAFGAGIYLAGGSATITRGYISHNIAPDGGGGIYVGLTASLVARDIVLDDNSALWGGAILQWGSLEILGGTLSRNDAYCGGALIVYGSSSKLANATISGNTALGSGGAICIAQEQSVQIASSTLVDNVADSDKDGHGDGGGVYIEGGCSGFCAPATAYFKNSILAGNVDLSPSGTQARDCFGDIRADGPNLFGAVSTSSFASCELLGSTQGSQFNVDPLLGPLSNNGGPIIYLNAPRTHLPGASSPARNAGDANGCLDHGGGELTSDQRGAPRVGVCDLGAVEADSTPALGQIFSDGFESGNLTSWG